MKAVKDNKEYNVNENTKAAYLAQGFTIIGDDGEVIERPAGATVPYEDYKAAADENAKEIDEMDLSFSALTELVNITLSAMTGKEPEENSGSSAV